MSSILSSLFSTDAASFIDDLTGSSIWDGLPIESVTFSSQSDNADGPAWSQYTQESSISGGLLVEDLQALKVIRPSTAEVCFIARDVTDLNQITSWFSFTFSTITVTSKSVVAIGMCIKDINVLMSGEMTQSMSVVVKMEQAKSTIQSSPFNPSQFADRSVLGLGIQAAKSSKIVSTASSLYNSITTKLGF